jgi:DNA-binding SARP family transcriptional activator/tetratricopeptide (TPR) repeat protein
MSRDKLVGLLWSEADSERARHSLTQALYAARRALKVDDLFIVGADIRLNRERIGSDFADFEAAIGSGELARAVELYQGPFLDGFYVSGAAEFERWASAQRDRLRGRVVDALERLATPAEEAGDYRAAVEWRRRLATLMPLDSAAAAKLMTALAMAGDRASALQHAEVHGNLLRAELGLEPDPVVVALAAKLKEPTLWSPPVLPEPGPQPPLDVADSLGPPVMTESPPTRGIQRRAPRPTPATPVSVSVGEWTPARPRPARWVRIGVTLSIATTLVAGGVMLERARRGDPSAELQRLAVRQRVVVAPFRIVGAAAGLEYLRDGMVELLSARLADDTAARSVDAGGVLAAWRASGLASTPSVTRSAVVNLAARLGAERAVVGSVVGSPRQLSITATVYAVPSGVSRGEATVSGPADSLTTLVDRLAARLLVAEAGEDERLANYTSKSLPALRAFLEAQAAFRRSDFIAATRLYDLAIRRDSTFALAALYRALTADELNDDLQLRAAVALAWTNRSALNDRDQTLLAAFAGSRFPAPPTVTEIAAAWQRVVDLAPASAEAWSALGARLLHDGAAAGLAAPLERAADAYQRALALNPGYVAAWRALAQLGAFPPNALERSAAPPDSTATQREAPAGVTPFVAWRLSATQNDTVALQRFRDTLPRLGPVTLRAIARTSQFDGIRIDDGAEALAVLQRRAAQPADLASLAVAEHSLAVNRGRPHDALAVTTRLRRILPGSHAWLRLRILDALYAEGDTLAAYAAVNELGDLVGARLATATTGSDVWLADACVLAQWRLGHGDTTGVAGIIASLAGAQRGAAAPLLVSTAPNACAALLDAALAVAVGRPDASARLQRADSMVFTPQVAGDAAAYAPLLMARLHQRRGSVALALRAVRRRTYLAGWPRYLANAWVTEARLARQLGDTAGAAAAYHRFLALRDTPEKALSPQVDSVRRLLAATIPTDAAMAR